MSIVVNLTFLAVAARALGVVEFGKLIYILAATSLLDMIFSGTTDSILVRELSRDPAAQQANFSVCFWIQACFAALIAITCATLAWLSRSDATLFYGFLVASMASISHAFFVVPVAHYRSEENMFFEAVLITGERFAFLIAFLAVVFFQFRTVAFLLCAAGTMAIKSSLSYIWLLRARPLKLQRPHLRRLLYFVRESLPLIAFSVIMGAHWRVDLVFVKTFSTAEQLGIYAASFRTMEMLRVLPIDTITAAFPIFCKLATSDEHGFGKAYETFVRSALSIGTLIAALGILLSYSATRILFGTSFTGAAVPLRILLLAFPLVFWNQIHNITLTATRRQKWMIPSLIAALVIQTFIDSTMIPRRGAAGAGLGFASGESVFLIGTLIAISPLSLRIGRSLTIAARLCLAGILAYGTGLLVVSVSSLAGAMLALTVFLVAIRVLGVVTRDDLQMCVAEVSRITSRIRKVEVADAAGIG